MRRAWVEVDLGALLRNARTAAWRTGVPLVPMVKADSYGLGSVPVARTLERLVPPPWGYGVATVFEGEELRRAGITRPIVLFTPPLVEELDAVQRAGLTPALGAKPAIEWWRDTGLPWHLAIDTGMSRAGIHWDRVGELRDLILEFPPEGAFTHFHSAEADPASRDAQESRFEQALAALPAKPRYRHAENSPALEHRAPSRWSLARPGIFLYGVGSGHGAEVVPEDVVSVRARVVDIRTISDSESVSYGATWRAAGSRKIATLSIGYADGYRRSLGNRATVLVRGVPVQVAGVVTMDMTMVDVTDRDCEVGDVATLIGSDGTSRVTVEDLAGWSGLSPYEILTGLRGRLPRKYVGLDTGNGVAGQGEGSDFRGT